MDQRKAGSREPAFFDLALGIVQEQLTHSDSLLSGRIDGALISAPCQ